ncbi:MAG: type IX secretion system membrane protein PorP/SprF [Bacteroidales bacterium]|jgi:type IX secretion system PorP/SprF family membrane protein|nr:type IX secretion system membrane protein PorP/SprF [Bacteroidales bacterium]
MKQINNMRKGFYFVLIVMCIGIAKVNAQQEPMFTQYSFNSLTINPAIAGTLPVLNVNSLTRLQWIGMDGAPKTFSLTSHSPIIGRKIGIGATLVTDKVGPVNNTFFTLNYAYRLRVTDELTLSMGIKGGISSYSVGLTDLSVINNEDPQFQNNDKKISPNLGFGFYLYGDKFHVGFSAPKLIQTTVDDVYATDENQLKRHYFIFGGYNWQINSDWVLKPGLLTKLVSGSPVSNDITIQTTYIDRFGGGLMYRIGDALGLFVNGIVYEELSVGYGYEYSLNGLSGVNGGTHEIMLMYNFKALTSDKKKKRKIFRF